MTAIAIPLIQFSDAIREKINGMRLGLLAVSGAEIHKKSDFVTTEFEKLDHEIRAEFQSSAPAENEVVSAVRRMYRRIGWEPTRYRPSSEAMIRRILKGIGLYRINNFVDLGNVASTRRHLPMGLYDLDKIQSEIRVDVGREDEAYQGISNPEIHAEGKLILRDDAGIFGNPTADSLRTSIQPETTAVLALFFCPPEVDDAWLTETVALLEKYYRSECPGITTYSENIGSED
jgi:DNA/RNA-binding domain of Phe-tRNA-synthetase-like protein